MYRQTQRPSADRRVFPALVVANARSRAASPSVPGTPPVQPTERDTSRSSRCWKTASRCRCRRAPDAARSRSSQSPATSVSLLSSTTSRSACSAMPRFTDCTNPSWLVAQQRDPLVRGEPSSRRAISGSGVASSTTTVSDGVRSRCRQHAVEAASRCGVALVYGHDDVDRRPWSTAACPGSRRVMPLQALAPPDPGRADRATAGRRAATS